MTRTPAGVTARQFIKALHNDGFALRRVRGSHHIYLRGARRVIVAYHRLGETFPVGTLKAMIGDAGWTDADLARLGLID